MTLISQRIQVRETIIEDEDQHARVGFKVERDTVPTLQRRQKVSINVPHIEDDVDTGEFMYGTQKHILQEKMAKEKHRNLINVPRIRMAHMLVKNNPGNELDMGYFHVNGITFLHKRSKNN